MQTRCNYIRNKQLKICNINLFFIIRTINKILNVFMMSVKKYIGPNDLYLLMIYTLPNDCTCVNDLMYIKFNVITT